MEAKLSRRGHTLPEVMVVIVILVLFATIAMPRFLGTVFRSKLDVSISAIRGDLDFARARAASSGLRHQVALDQQTRELRVVPFRPEEMAEGAAQIQYVQQDALKDTISPDVTVVEWTVTPMMGASQQAQATGDVLTVYPEGWSDSLQVVLEDGAGERRGLILQGYTGELREMLPEEIGSLAR